MLDKLVTVNLDKERHLRLTLKGMLEFQKHTGKNLLKGFRLKELSLEDSAALIWACLIHEDKEIKYEDVLNMIDLHNLTSVVNAVAECINQSLPEAEKAVPLAEKPQPG